MRVGLLMILGFCLSMAFQSEHDKEYMFYLLCFTSNMDIISDILLGCLACGPTIKIIIIASVKPLVCVMMIIKIYGRAFLPTDATGMHSSSCSSCSTSSLLELLDPCSALCLWHNTDAH